MDPALASRKDAESENGGITARRCGIWIHEEQYLVLAFPVYKDGTDKCTVRTTNIIKFG
jgi:hypothetical protein